MVDIPRKRQRDEFSDRNRGLFKYVDTVEGDNFFKDPNSAQHLQVILEAVWHTTKSDYRPFFRTK